VILDQLVQDVFVEAYMSLKGFRGRAPFLHWLRRVATRVGFRYWKSRTRKKAGSGLEGNYPEPDRRSGNPDPG
jgi:DNA-directed RNA polymerase specialized sigma24 family protein